MHGYAILRDVSERTGGEFQLLPGTLYSTLKKLLDEGSVEACRPPRSEGAVDDRRRYYRLTALGRKRATEETERMAMMVRLARKKGFASS